MTGQRTEALFVGGGIDVGSSTALSDLLGELLAISPADDTLPFIAPVLLYSRLETPRSFTQAADKQGRLVLHEYQSIALHQSLSSDTDFFVETQVQPGGPDTLTIDVRVLNAAQLPAASLRFGLRLAARGHRLSLAGRPTSAAIRSSDVTWLETGPITAPLVARYVALAGDTNPIHTDLPSAQALGLDRPVVPGMMLVGLGEYALRKVHPDKRISQLRARFLSAVPIDETVRIALEDRPGDGDGSSKRLYYGRCDGTLALIVDMSCADTD